MTRIDKLRAAETFRCASIAAGLTLIFALAACTTGDKKEDVVAGTIHVCSSCHGMEGRSVSPTFPRLAGQQKDYLEVQLKAFRDHSRADPHAHTYMWGMAAALSDQTIDGVATYYASQAPAPGHAQDPAAVAAGRKIYEEGVPERGVPACGGCHGDNAEGGGAFPRLAGQHRAYLEGQLAAFSANSRANEIMHENTKGMTPQDMREVAAFLATQ